MLGAGEFESHLNPFAVARGRRRTSTTGRAVHQAAGQLNRAVAEVTDATEGERGDSPASASLLAFMRRGRGTSPCDFGQASARSLGQSASMRPLAFEAGESPGSQDDVSGTDVANELSPASVGAIRQRSAAGARRSSGMGWDEGFSDSDSELASPRSPSSKSGRKKKISKLKGQKSKNRAKLMGMITMFDRKSKEARAQNMALRALKKRRKAQKPKAPKKPK